MAKPTRTPPHMPVARRAAASLAACAVLTGAWLATANASSNEARRTARVLVRPGETVEQALRRAGASTSDAREAAPLLEAAVGPGDLLEVMLAGPRGRGGSPRLAGLTAPGSRTPVAFSRAYDGVLRRADDPPPLEGIGVAEGVLQDSLSQSAERAGAGPALTEEVTALFAKRLDLARDLASGDRFRLVFRRTVASSGATLETGPLLYAEIDGKAGASRFYAFDYGGRTQYLDAAGAALGAFLLHTPVTGARISSPYGMRMHPILGYSRMHQGVDFAAAPGTPVMAAADGVVTEAGRRGGYGRWLRISHGGSWDTGYAHLARTAPGIEPGTRVRQGEVVAFVGASGEATGPHLHYEVWRDGARVDPASVPEPVAGRLTAEQRNIFERQKAAVDDLLAAQPKIADGADLTQAAGLRARLAPGGPLQSVALRLTPET